jgi:glutamyl-tRNA synthetase
MFISLGSVLPMSVITRFAPSPTGYLHIGGARTALFNWLFARHHGGKFLLRIEDTDRERSIPAAITAIIDGLKWFGLDWDDEVILQSTRQARHAEVVEEMLARGTAYRCYCTPEELAAARERQKAEGRPLRYEGIWRDRNPSEAPPGVKPVIRVRAEQTGSTIVEDGVQGRVEVANGQLDDLILLRADGTPTYMLSVVVDDHDMGITHVIRGDDHLTNTFRQIQIYRAVGWEPPHFSHLPLIHGADGLKLSKRRNAASVEEFRDMGYLPEALRNYLLRLGWAHGDDETISTERAVEWFDLPAVGRSPSRFDFTKLDNLNGHYLREADDARLVALIAPRLGDTLSPVQEARLLAGMDGLKARAKTLVELAQNAGFYVAARPLALDEKAGKLATPEARRLIGTLGETLQPVNDWSEPVLEEKVRNFAETQGVKLGTVAQPLRAALTGAVTSPGIFEVMRVLGHDESIGRMGDFAAITGD